MAFALGKQGHTYNITEQEMGEARRILLGFAVKTLQGGKQVVCDIHEEESASGSWNDRVLKTLIFTTLRICPGSQDVTC